MRPWQLGLVGSIAAGLMAGVAASPPQSTDVSADLVREPALQYFTKPATDAVARLNADLQRGAARLTFDDTGGYLPYLLTRIGWDTRVALQAGRPDAAAGSRHGYVRVRGEVFRGRAGGSSGPIAAAAGSLDAAPPVSVQLHDLRRRLRRASVR